MWTEFNKASAKVCQYEEIENERNALWEDIDNLLNYSHQPDASPFYLSPTNIILPIYFSLIQIKTMKPRAMAMDIMNITINM